MSFTKEQTAQFRTLSAMYHPDKLVSQSVVVQEMGAQVSAILNNAKDKGDWFTVSDILRLTAKHRVTKTDYAGLAELLAEFETIPKNQTNFKSGPKAKAQPKAKPTVNETILNHAREQQNATGWDRKKMTAWMGLEYDLFGAYAKAYLDLVFAKKKGEARVGWASQLYAELAQGPMTRADLVDWIKSTGSKNVASHETHYWAICELANRIWASK